MKNSSLSYLLPFLVLASSPVAAALPNMQEGLWEITTKVEISGLPEGLPEHTVQHCVTKKDLEEGKARCTNRIAATASVQSRITKWKETKRAGVYTVAAIIPPPAADR